MKCSNTYGMNTTEKVLYIIDMARLENRPLNEAEYDELIMLLKGDVDYMDLTNFTYEELRNGGQED